MEASVYGTLSQVEIKKKKASLCNSYNFYYN